MTLASLESHRQAGLQAFELQDWDSAIKAWTRAVNHHLAAASDYYLLGQAYDKAGQSQMAIEQYEQSILLDPQCYQGYFLLAQALVPLRQAREPNPEHLQRAIWACQQATQLVPQWSIAWTLLAKLMNLTGNFTAAAIAATQAIKLSGVNDLSQPNYNSHRAHYALVEAIFEQGRYCSCAKPLLLDFSTFDGQSGPELHLPTYQGDVPTQKVATPTLVITADEPYIFDFALPQVLSLWVHEPSWPVHWHVVNPSQRIHSLCQQLRGKFPHAVLSYSWEQVQWPPGQMKLVYLASLRLMRAAEWMRQRDQPLILVDADLLYRTAPHTLLPTQNNPDVALVAYPGSAIYDRYGAAWVVLYPTALAHQCTTLLGQFLKRNLALRGVWMLDQFALYCCLSHCRTSLPELNLQLLPPQTVSCDYAQDQTIWNGAGERKFRDNAFTRYRQQLLAQHGFASATYSLEH